DTPFGGRLSHSGALRVHRAAGLGQGLRWGELSRVSSSNLEVSRRESHETQGILLVHHTTLWKVRRVPLQRALFDERRVRVGRFLPIINPAGFARIV
ncbi:MAG: hypothetical protein ABIR01_05300, partial [Candidatus Eisenbacteria bacterium]